MDSVRKCIHKSLSFAENQKPKTLSHAKGALFSDVTSPDFIATSSAAVAPAPYPVGVAWAGAQGAQQDTPLKDLLDEHRRGAQEII